MSSSNEEYKEVLLCKEEELPNDESMKSFDVEGVKVLLARHQGQLCAIGGKCTHYGAPLEKGALANGRVRCPWHGACFSLATGDIEDFPGLDSIPKFDVDVADGQVKVRGPVDMFSTNKRVKNMAKRDPENKTNFVIIGGGAAGNKCAETLRQEGFTGGLTLISREVHVPYDRPLLSKGLDRKAEEICLRQPSFYKDSDIELVLNASAVALDTLDRKVRLDSGDEMPFHKLFIATGGKPRALTVPGHELSGIFVLRTPEDANNIAEAAKGQKVVVVGSSFIGMEAAAYLLGEDRAASVTVIGNSAVPFEQSLGSVVGERIQRLFEEKGARFINNEQVVEIKGNDGTVSEVVLQSGAVVDANVVLVGIGVIPDTEFLASSGVSLSEHGYVPVNEFLETNIEGVYCGGDIVSFPLFLHGGALTNIGHWQVAHYHGHTAALNMLGRSKEVHSVPFFWTVLFGKSIRYTGHGKYDDVIISGDLQNLSFIAYYCDGNRVVALASLMKDPAASKYAERLQQGLFLSKDEVLANGDAALHL